MLHKSKLLVFLGSLVIVLYGAAAAFYGRVAAKEDAYKEISVFIDVLTRVEDNYVEVPDLNKIQEGAMRGLISALDPYSSFLPKEQYEAIRKRNESGKANAGLILSKRSDVVYVVSCESNGPAAQAGIRPGDYVVSINRYPVEDKSILEVNSLLRGAPQSTIKMEIFRSSESEPLNMELALKEPSSVSVKSSLEAGNVGLLKVFSLENASVQEIRGALNALISRDAEKILLDLRNCADGTPAAGAQLANYFLRDGIIYFSQNRLGEKVRIVEADPEKFITDLPVVVLINSSTAAAAEITAGALKDRDRATLVGEKSFGVGSDQKTIFLKSGAVLVLSTAKFCTPDGNVIQGENERDSGILPDILTPDSETRQDLVVESYYDDSDEAEKYRELMQKIERLQMEKALEVLQETNMLQEKAA